MTDDPQDRRRQDPKLDQILNAIEEHKAEYHAFNKKQLLVMVEEHQVNTETIPVLLEGQKQDKIAHERLLLVIEGEPVVNAHGDIIAYEGGMRHDIADLKHQGNGGGGFSLRAKDKAQLTALFTFIVILANAAKELL